jgi:hypothetical protein
LLLCNEGELRSTIAHTDQRLQDNNGNISNPAGKSSVMQVIPKQVTMNYNNLGQYTSLTRNHANYSTTQVTPTTWTEVATSNYTYDSLSRLAALSHGRTGTGISGPLVGSNGQIEYNYTYDLRNRITQLTSVEGVSNYAYDGEDQVLAANYSPVSTVSAALQNESYGHDLNGNRWQRSRGANSYDVTTGTNNQVTDDGEYTYTYAKGTASRSSASRQSAGRATTIRSTNTTTAIV